MLRQWRAVGAERDRYLVLLSAMSDEARVVAGYALSARADPGNRADPGLAYRSFIWRCR